MNAAMMFLSVFAAAWLTVAGTTIIHLRRWRGMRRNISLVARAGQRWRCRSLRFLIRLPQVAMSHQAPARLWERS